MTYLRNTQLNERQGSGLKLSAEHQEKANKFQSLVLKHVMSTGQNTIAELLATSETTVSRFVSAELERACKVLAVLDLKIVPTTMKCYPSDQIDAIFSLAKARMEEMDSAEKLSFED